MDDKLIEKSPQISDLLRKIFALINGDLGDALTGDQMNELGLYDILSEIEDLIDID